jgi:hypothetical protein
MQKRKKEGVMDIVVIKEDIEHIVGINREKNKAYFSLAKGTELPINKKTDRFKNNKKFFCIWLVGYKVQLPTELIKFKNWHD